MKTIEKSQTIKHCPNCEIVGEVVKNSRGYLTMICPSCEAKWRTDSELCGRCHKPNGFAVPGLCSKCYADHLEFKW
ncbi:ribosomal protein L40E [Bacillus pakistanensis]|uniref:Ribosomal protein L40E n=1 Tax=Rossellomorea pakistanensis TaxID=992288 RepID=A0ABS2NDA7_9BACI|nr:ribosomal protein L40E [Bacillus pakistanensis]